MALRSRLPVEHPAFTRRDLRVILVCHEGYQSSLAAATPQQFGLIHATDLDGGFTAWTAAGLPVILPPASSREAAERCGRSILVAEPFPSGPQGR